MKRLIIASAFAFSLQSQEGTATEQNRDQLQIQLKAANERISQLEERVKLLTLQQQGAIQFFQAGQALCELDKLQPSKTPETK